MEAFMWLNKENGNLHLLQTKANQGPSPQLSKGLLQVRNAKTLAVAKPKASRKALGNVNHHVQPRKPASIKVATKDNSVKQRCEKYPDIETFIPYNPLAFETFAVPEEHRLSDRCLAGGPLFVSRGDAHRFDALVSRVLSPMETEPINYDSYEMSILYEEIIMDLPMSCEF